MTRQIPMLFSPAMVEALLAGRKTETRRITKLQSGTYFKKVQMPNPEFIGWQTNAAHGRGPSQVHIGPQVGDLIWVKEAHYAYGYWRTIPDALTKAGKPKREFVRDAGHCITKGELAAKSAIKFRPDNIDVLPQNLNMRPGWFKRSSLFMPKADSRLTLPVTGFGIERLQDIDEASAAAEGVERLASPTRQKYPFKIYGNRTIGDGCRSAKDSYKTLWDSINGFLAWHANPWVDVTKFDVLHQNVREVAA